jgi:pimeloyl-ACP methyl ester carboxylesterase
VILLALAICSFSGPNIFTVTTPVSYTDPSQGTWEQSFQVIYGTVMPTISIIAIPGGPGATTITPNPPAQYIGTPAAWNAILTDPRGAGCNVGPPASTFSTDTLARDVLTVIKRVQATDYIVVSTSYGTVEATELETLIEADPSLARPRAVVLEGCVGHAWTSDKEAFLGYAAEWDRVKTSVLQPQTVARFAGPPYPLGISSVNWALIISSELRVGTTPGGQHPLQALLEPIDPRAIRQTLAQLQAQAIQLKPLDVPISCNELDGSRRYGDLVNNELVVAGPDQCSQGFTNRYDSANFPSTVPLYHFQGQFDPAVIPAQSMYHHLAHAASPSSYVVIENAGHEALFHYVGALGCLEPIWQAIANNADVSPGLTACGVGFAVVQRTPGQPLLPMSVR